MINEMTQFIDEHGMVNTKRIGDVGNEPVRVLHFLLLVIFKQAYPTFNIELNDLIEKGDLNPEIYFITDPEPIKTERKYLTPRLNLETKQIELHETFLSFLWSSIYSLYVLYAEKIDYPYRNEIAGYNKHLIDKENIQKASELHSFAKALVVIHENWDKKALPNPEYYHPKINDYIWQVNSLYSYAVAFILCHEFVHAKEHAHKMEKQTPPHEIKRFEIEADARAIEMLKKGLMVGNSELAVAQRLVVETGIVLGMLSMFFLKKDTQTTTHPRLEDRITNALESLPLLDNEFVWGIACLALQLWEEQFNLNFEWKNNISAQEQYYHIVKQIKVR